MAKKILFVCKHNVFRSRVAEEYLKKINSNLDITSAGIIQSKTCFDQNQFEVGKEFDLDLSLNSKTLSIEGLRDQDLVVVLASDVPKEIFNNPLYGLQEKIEFWNIDDVDNLFTPTKENSREIMQDIMARIDKLNERLSNE